MSGEFCSHITAAEHSHGKSSIAFAKDGEGRYTGGKMHHQIKRKRIAYVT